MGPPSALVDLRRDGLHLQQSLTLRRPYGLLLLPFLLFGTSLASAAARSEGGPPSGLRLVYALVSTLLLLAAPGVQAEWLAGRVVAVADGDTVALVDSAQTRHKIRLAGIDAPESRQPYGQIARQGLSELVEGQWVRVQYDKSDRYGRVVGRIEHEGRDVNLELLRRGLAWHFKKYQNEQSEADRTAYAAAEQQAQSARLGLWRDTRPQAPWDYRAQTRQASDD